MAIYARGTVYRRSSNNVDSCHVTNCRPGYSSSLAGAGADFFFDFLLDFFFLCFFLVVVLAFFFAFSASSISLSA
jgi:hypothetical protein